MHEIGAFEAKNTLGALLDLVEKGEEIVITRRGKPVARMVRETGVSDRSNARRAAAEIMQMRKGKKLGGVITIKELITECRT